MELTMTLAPDTEAIVTGRSRSPRTLRRTRNQGSGGILWILPALVLVLGMIYFSIGYTGFVSLRSWNGFILSPSEFEGGKNFARMFGDPVFWNALGHTLIFFVVTFTVQTVIGFTFAAIMHSRLKLKAVYKVIIFVPTVLAPATMAPVFRSIFDAHGQFNDVLHAIGLGSLASPWLANEATAMPVIMLITVWQWTGLTFILFFAAMSQIDSEVLEAARLDGAGSIRTLVSIVWPMCSGTTIALATLGIIGALKTFDVPYLVTKGGPNHATEFLGTYIYQEMVQEKHFGYAAALSVALLVLAIGGGVLTRLRSRRERGV
ncbi:raffinose/stachyose/melibiose transport system permease protein [Microbacterium sp. W4I4]|uniref:carbohydrate ABC transporter permease n=1 Tax=Microbacterium sp. W4I4 TaxID=3042295 RepID=UPI0027843A1D|nr:sugar ABC transporter permease [Microbacterium sp. W4I4]MDQ0614947.1 raffinose/stachyose/melibiose transport system permease protein [Microbacterium sp. W4I4]